MRKKKRTYQNIKQSMVWWAFLLPNLLGVLCFTLLPMLQVLRRSFQSAIGDRWMGFQNYMAVLKNPAFQIAVSNTVRFTLVCVPLLVALSLALALAVRATAFAGGTLRSAFLMPMAVPAASVVLVWKVLFHEKGKYRELYGNTLVIWITDDPYFARVAIRTHSFDFIVRPLEGTRFREPLRSLST